MNEARDRHGYTIAPPPHPLAWFDPSWRSAHAPAPLDGWRFCYACTAGCPDAIGDMPVTKGPDAYPRECPDCGGPVALLDPAAGEKAP